MEATASQTSDADQTAYYQSLIDEARRALAAGKVVDHERVSEWLQALAEGRDLPPPSPDPV